MNWNYLAGFIDGEGSIIQMPTRVRIYISNTDKKILEEIQNFVKCGKIHTIDRKNKKWKIQYAWICSDHKNCLRILENLKDKLVVKKKKCLDTIKFIKGKRWMGNYISKEELLKLKHLPYRKIAKELGISHYCVFRYLKKYNIK